MVIRALAAAALASGLCAGGLSLTAQQFSARTGSSVVLGARAQIQYEASSEKDVPATFSVRRVWVTIDGTLNDLVSGRVQFNADGASVLEAYLQLSPSDAFRVQIGQFKKAMSYFWLAANSDLPLIERDGRVTGVSHCPGVGGVCSFGQFTGSLGLDNYEPGVLMTGRFANRRMGYRVTVTNGEGLGKKDVNTRKSVSSRLSTFFGDNGRLSAYVAMDEILTARGETMGVPAYGAELQVGTWRNGPHLLVNGLSGRNWKLSDEANFSAFQVMGLWYRPFPEGSSLAAWEPLLRVSWANSGSADDVSGTVITPGVMVYAIGRNGISANLDLYRSSDSRSHWSFKIQAFTFF